MNDRGQVVGRSEPASGEPHAFLWQDGVLIDLGGGAWSEASDINERGQIVGSSNVGSGQTRAALWEDGGITDLGGLESGANAIGDGVEVAGWSQLDLGEPRHAVLWQDGEIIDLGTLAGGNQSEATAINGRGQVVGWSSTGMPATLYGRPHAFLLAGWSDGRPRGLQRRLERGYRHQ
jgi:probable HAF family extracellular repeat protein